MSEFLKKLKNEISIFFSKEKNVTINYEHCEFFKSSKNVF